MFTREVNWYREINLFTLIPTIVISLIIFITLMSGWYTVQPWQVAFEKTFGKIDTTLNTEGLYFKLPWFTEAIKMNTRNIVVTTTESSASKDVQIVTTEAAVNFSLQASSAVELYSTIWNERAITERIVNKAIQESIKAATAKFTATESITKREEVREVMITNLEEKLNPRGIVINQLDITDFDFSDEFNRAIEAKVTAEQDALKSKALVEKVKYEAESKIAKAEGDAKAVEIAAIAEAEAIRIKAKAIQVQWGTDYIQLKWIEAWQSWGAKVPTYLSEWWEQFLLNIK